MSPNRRTLLAGLAGGLAGLAGCGYRPAGGERRWSTGIGGLGSAERVLFDGGRLLVVVPETRGFDFEAEEWYEGGELTIIDPLRGERTGQERFREPLVTAACVDTTAYAGLRDGRVHAVPLDEGRSRTPEPSGAPGGSPGEGEAGDGWDAATDVAPAGVTTLAAGERVYAGGSEGAAALAPADGAVVWRWTGGTVRSVVPGHGGSDTAAHALTDDRVVALGGDGAVRWTRRVSSAEPPVVTGDGVYLADADGLVALTPDGRERWSRAVGEPVVRPAVADGRLYHVSWSDVARSLSPDGREHWRAEVPAGAQGMAADSGRVFLRYHGSLAGVGPEGLAWRADMDTEEGFDPRFGPFAVGDAVVLAGDSEVRSYWQSQLPREG
jgi:hypothetical protein